jgi:selT/selW/selH-like putative selenoprotein
VGYDEQAASLAAAIGPDATAVPGETSQFDVFSDGELVFSKQRTGRFPEQHEILQALGRL